MTLLYIDGFDDRAADSSHMTQKRHSDDGTLGVVLETAASINSGGGRLGTNCLRLASNNQLIRIGLGAGHTDPVMYWGCAMSTLNDSGGSDGNFYLYGDNGSTNHLTFNVEADLSISVNRGSHSGTELGRTAAGITAPVGGYIYFEFKVTIHDSTGTVDIWKNGVNVLTLSSQDTKNGGTNSYIDQFSIQASDYHWDCDDIYVGNTQGANFTDVLNQDVHVETVFPDTEAGTIQWTPSAGADNSDTIDESPATNDTDYNSIGSTGQIDELNMVHVTDATNEVFGVQVSSWAQKDGVGSPVDTFRHRIVLSGSTADGADQTLPEGFAWFMTMHELDPAGSTWTGANVDAATVGYESR